MQLSSYVLVKVHQPNELSSGDWNVIISAIDPRAGWGPKSHLSFVITRQVFRRYNYDCNQTPGILTSLDQLVFIMSSTG